MYFQNSEDNSIIQKCSFSFTPNTFVSDTALIFMNSQDNQKYDDRHNNSYSQLKKKNLSPKFFSMWFSSQAKVSRQIFLL